MKKRKRVSKLRITDSVNEKLDAIVDVESTDVYNAKIKRSVEEEMLEILGEEVFDLEGKKDKKLNSADTYSSYSFKDILVTVILVLGLLGLIILTYKMIV